MGTVVLCTSCPLLNECVISHNVCFPLKKKSMRIVFSSYPYYTLVHNHIWISYFIPYFQILECRFIPRQHRNTLLSVICLFIQHQYLFFYLFWDFHPNKTCTNHDEVHPAFFFLYLKLYSIITTWHTFGMLSDMLIVFLITSELCKPSVFGLPLKKYHRKPIY